MEKHKKRQALAVTSRLSSQIALPGILGGDIAALETEAARIVSEDIAKRAGNGSVPTSGHVVIDGGRLSGLIRDAHTTVRFSGGSIAVTTHE
jgi:hypothetical protein